MMPDTRRWSPALRQAVRASLTRWLSIVKQRPGAAIPILVDCGVAGHFRVTVAEAEELVSQLAAEARGREETA